jgi:hypothetical protein
MSLVPNLVGHTVLIFTTTADDANDVRSVLISLPHTSSAGSRFHAAGQ